MKLVNFILCLWFVVIDQSSCSTIGRNIIEMRSHFNPTEFNQNNLLYLKKNYPDFMKLKLKVHKFYYQINEFCPNDPIILPKPWDNDSEYYPYIYYAGTEIDDQPLMEILNTCLITKENYMQGFAITLNAIESVCLSYINRFCDFAIELKENRKLPEPIYEKIKELLYIIKKVFKKELISTEAVNFFKNIIIRNDSAVSNFDEMEVDNISLTSGSDEDEKSEICDAETNLVKDTIKTNDSKTEVDNEQYIESLLQCKKMVEHKLDFTDIFTHIKYSEDADAEKKLIEEIDHLLDMFFKFKMNDSMISNPLSSMLSRDIIDRMMERNVSQKKRSTSIQING